MEKNLAKIYRTPSDVSIKDNYYEECYPNLEDKINSYRTIVYNHINVGELLSR